jgi:hypothetical protein
MNIPAVSQIEGENEMKFKATVMFAAVLVCAILVLAKKSPSNGALQSGDWTMRHAAGEEYAEFSLMSSHEGNHFQHSSDWAVSEFHGLDLTKTAHQEVHFTIDRDAGTFQCQGFLENGEGAGTFHFAANEKYPKEMASLGFSGINSDEQFAMALHDVSLKFAQDMKDEHLQDLDKDKLIAFRIHGVSKNFIENIRAAGQDISDSDKLIAFRIHGVSPEMIRSLHQSGYSPDADKLIAMRIHGATPEWIEQLKKDGYDHVQLDELIAFRIHGVSPEFIDKLQKLGYSHPEPDQLIAMRIHGVTPEFISNLRGRGMQNLSVDQLVSLRIHGID